MKLEREFYSRDDVVEIARELLGKYLFTRIDNTLTGGIITETEAYAGVVDKASHAYKGKRTNRTEIMYLEGGAAYIYLCYGIHSLFNIVTNVRDVPHAVLIRAIYPTHGIEIMQARKVTAVNSKQKIAKGPGSVSKVLGIHYSHSGLSLLGKKIWLEDRGVKIKAGEIIAGPRIGVDYAGEDAKLPYRFQLIQKL